MAGGNTMVQPNSTEQALFSEFTEWRFQDSPEFATMFGIHKYDDQVSIFRMLFDHRYPIIVCAQVHINIHICLNMQFMTKTQFKKMHIIFQHKLLVIFQYN